MLNVLGLNIRGVCIQDRALATGDGIPYRISHPDLHRRILPSGENTATLARHFKVDKCTAMRIPKPELNSHDEEPTIRRKCHRFNISMSAKVSNIMTGGGIP